MQRHLLSLLTLLLLRAAPATPADAAAIDAITSWLTDEGAADLSAVTVGEGVRGERGVRTTRAVAAGEVILRGRWLSCPPACLSLSQLLLAVWR